MKTLRQMQTGQGRVLRRAFSLIELLVVIGVIVALAAMTFPVVNAVKRAQSIHRARAELAQIDLAIQAYKEKLGFYPPDNDTPGNWTKNQLYYELMGTTATMAGNTVVVSYKTLDDSASLRATSFPQAFPGGKVVGFMNSTKSAGDDDAAGAIQFLKGLKPAQFMPQLLSGFTNTILGVSISGSPVVPGMTGEIVPYGYNSSSPKHNPKSFDLWVDIVAGGKTNRICNWSEKPIVVYYTSLLTSYP